MTKIKLSEICDLQNGYAFKSTDYVEESNTLSCRMSNIRLGGIFDIEYNSRYLPDSFAEKFKSFLLQDGDLVIAMTDLANDPKLLGVPTLVQTNGKNILLNQRVGKLVIKNSSKVDNKYLQYVLNDPKTRKYYKKFASGGLQINLGKSDLLNVEIFLPPIDEQRRIASILDKADELRKKRQQSIKKLDQLLLATFIDMFGDPVSNPKGWVKEKMDTLMTIVRGGSPRPIENFLGGNYPWIKIGDATKGDDLFITKTKEAITKEGLHKTRLLPEGSVIFANCGVSLGFARILKIQGCIHDGWLAFQDINEDKVHKLFLLKALNSITQYFRDTAPDGTQPNLNTAIMKNFELTLPPMELQLKFITVVELIEKQKKMLDTSKKEVSNLFKSLQNQAFSGNL